MAALIGFFYRNHVVKRPVPIAQKSSNKPFATQTIGDFAVNLFTSGDQLRSTGNDVVIEFRDAGGTFVDVGEVKLELDMNMTGMVMHKPARVERTATTGQYRATVQPEMGGEWMAKISYSSPRGKAEKQFSVVVK